MSNPLEGEVVLMDDEIKSELEQLDTPSNEIAISQMLDKAQSWLQVAKQQADAPRAIADFKAEIIAVAQYAKQKKVSEEIQLDATLMVRRAERELGLAIREGQERGEIFSPGVRANSNSSEGTIWSPTEFATKNELSGEHGIYRITDDVSDEEFSDALGLAKEEGNPARRNLYRKIQEVKGVPQKPQNSKSALDKDDTQKIKELSEKGMSSREIGDELGFHHSTVNRALKPKTKAHQTQKTMERLTASLWGLRQSLQTITAIDESLDPDQAKAWIKELSSTSAEINRIKNLLKAGQ